MSHPGGDYLLMARVRKISDEGDSDLADVPEMKTVLSLKQRSPVMSQLEVESLLVSRVRKISDEGRRMVAAAMARIRQRLKVRGSRGTLRPQFRSVIFSCPEKL